MKISILLTDGSFNNMTNLLTIITGAVTFDHEVDVWVMDEAAWAFRKDRIGKDMTNNLIDKEFEEAFMKGVESGTVTKWWEQLADLKDFGEINVVICSLMGDIADLKLEDFELVDRVATIATYMEMLEEADRTISL